MPEVLVVCLVQDSVLLRTRWAEVLENALSPLFCALSALQRESRLLVGGVVYRAEPRAALDALVRPETCLDRIAFMPAPRFASAVDEALQVTALTPTSDAVEWAWADGIAAALEVGALRSPDVGCARCSQAHGPVCP